MKRLLVAFTIAVSAFTMSAAWALHFSAYRAYCMTESGGARLVSVYIYDPDNTLEVHGEWHGVSQIFDPETGVRAFLEEKLGPDWEAHPSTVMDKVVGRCPSYIGS